ncbi:hypothetical protein Pmani_002782 [Petrolisthes manimaculis]|uniref:Uncharacterized protein n=1 Tax=Petrolisthes manimaculis TaxID=1843537 RepID=A0AAE1QHV5_9EUCA|nr:hypothetical protein Pmani_002743 [Petrolisthes manimaculis]KAK4326726.1 hypothetical protein Pmani_002745 [Petrolisthes manimaculis]KAK4326753.1 hypothetical protein Pmani_002770 [Petrolisthes manimaculis]KAK4326765.1 hypothetical protein Pmani_002782 [Petrolisthes manimaculis]
MRSSPGQRLASTAPKTIQLCVNMTEANLQDSAPQITTGLDMPDKEKTSMSQIPPTSQGAQRQHRFTATHNRANPRVANNGVDMLDIARKIESITSKLETKDMEIEQLNTEVKTAYHTIELLQQRVTDLEQRCCGSDSHQPSVANSLSSNSCLLLGDTNLRPILLSDLHNNCFVWTIQDANMDLIKSWVTHNGVRSETQRLTTRHLHLKQLSQTLVPLPSPHPRTRLNHAYITKAISTPKTVLSRGLLMTPLPLLRLLQPTTVQHLRPRPESPLAPHSSGQQGNKDGEQP